MLWLLTLDRVQDGTIGDALDNIGGSLSYERDLAAAGAARACRRPSKKAAEHMRHIKRSEKGQAMVEFALVAPILFLILFGIIQFGIAFMNSVALTDAVRAGARKAAVSRTAANPTQATTTAVLGAATDLDPSKLSSQRHIQLGVG